MQLSHVKALVDFQSAHDLLLAPKLSNSSIDVSSGHFEKMNVGSAMHLFSKSVSAGLKYLVEKEGYSQDLLTTAWFIETVDHWLDLMSSRHPVLALSKKNLTSYS